MNYCVLNRAYENDRLQKTINLCDMRDYETKVNERLQLVSKTLEFRKSILSI